MMLWDTGALLAAISERDRYHVACRELVRQQRGPLQVPAPVLNEVAYFLQKRRGSRVEAAFLRSIAEDEIRPIHPESSDWSRAAELVETYASFPLGTVDASVMAIAERLKVHTIATLDRRHFYAVPLKHCQSGGDLNIVP